MDELTTISILEDKYKSFYRKKNYRIYDNIPLLSKDDPTLMLVNSTIAAFKENIKRDEIIPKTAHIQDCFRANGDLNNSSMMLFFKMVGNIAMIESVDSILSDFISFLTESCKIPAEQIYSVIHKEDLDLQSAWRNSVLSKNLVLINNGEAEQYSTRWKYGEGYNFLGRGLTIVCENPSIKKCSVECDLKCDCERYLQLGNIIIVESNSNKNIYLDCGFGIERIASYHYNNDIYKVPEFKRLVDHLSSYGFNEKISKKIINLVRGIFQLVSVGINPTNKREGYVLKSLIRSLANEIIIFSARDYDVILNIYDNIFDVMENFDFEINVKNKEIVIEEIKKYVLSINRGIIQAKKFVKKNLNIPEKALLKKLTDTFGLPDFIIKDVIGELNSLAVN